MSHKIFEKVIVRLLRRRRRLSGRRGYEFLEFVFLQTHDPRKKTVVPRRADERFGLKILNYQHVISSLNLNAIAVFWYRCTCAMTEDLLKFSLDIASQLGDVLATLPINDGPEQWELVEQTAQKLATALRIKDPAGTAIC
jgi:hypothetical protein